jgi:flagellar capping protein FliD
MSLADMGIGTDTNIENFGQIAIRDMARFEEAMENNFNDVRSLFTNAGGSGGGTLGIAHRVEETLRRETGTNSALVRAAGDITTASMENSQMGRRIRDQENRIENFIRILERREAAYFARFSRLEVALMQSESQMDFMMQMLWNN